MSNRLIRKAAATIDRLAAIDDRDDAVRALRGNIKEALAQNLRDADRFAAAVSTQLEVVALRAASVGSPSTAKQLGVLGFSQMILGVIARDAGNRTLACASWGQSYATLSRARATGKILGFHAGFLPGLEAHVRACKDGGSIAAPMR